MKTIRPIALLIAATLVTPAFAKVDFAKDVLPILQKSCIECHGPEKQKGKLRLDSKEATLKGGENVKAIVVGKGAESELYKRTALPRDHDDVMPPKGEGLTKAQQEILKQWIDEGADWPASAIVAGPKVDPVKVAGPKPSAAELKAVQELAKVGVNARELANGVNWRYANFRVAGSKFDAKTFGLLKDIQNLQELNLSNVELKDADLASISGLKNLERLNLASSTVTDAGLVHVKKIASLTHLNLFGTKVTDAGIKQLGDLKNLKSVYLFESKATDAGIAALQKALPNTRIDRGWDLKELAKIEAAAKEAQAKAEAKKADEKKAEPKKADAKKPAAKKKEKK